MTLHAGYTLADYDRIDCPHCGAKHKWFLERESIDCYRCNQDFKPEDATVKVEYLKQEQQAQYRAQHPEQEN